MSRSHRKPQVCVLGSAEPGSRAYELAAQAGEAMARLGITVVSGCGSPATRVAAERAIQANGLVLSIVPPDQMPPPDWPATVVVPCGMGDARNLLMALAALAAGLTSCQPTLPTIERTRQSSLGATSPNFRRTSVILAWSEARRAARNHSMPSIFARWNITSCRRLLIATGERSISRFDSPIASLT